MQHTKIRLVILDAYDRGYRVTPKGVLLSPFGQELPIKVRASRRHSYPFFCVSVAPFIAKSKRFGIPVHRFAAYCFYGSKVFENEVCVRHLDGNVLDVSRRNVRLGTYSENELDKPAEVRHRSARLARMSQGRLPRNCRFTERQVEHIRQTCNKGPRGTQSRLAKKFGVAKTTISKMVRGESYAA